MYDLRYTGEAIQYAYRDGIDYRNLTPHCYIKRVHSYLKRYLRENHPLPNRSVTYKTRFTPANAQAEVLAEHLNSITWIDEVIQQQAEENAQYYGVKSSNSKEYTAKRWRVSLANTIIMHLRCVLITEEILESIPYGLQYIARDPHLSYKRMRFYGYGCEVGSLTIHKYIRLTIKELMDYVFNLTDRRTEIEGALTYSGVLKTMRLTMAKTIIRKLNETGLVLTEEQADKLPDVIANCIKARTEAGVHPPTLLLSISQYVDDEFIQSLLAGVS